MAIDLSVYLVIGARDSGPRGVVDTVKEAVAGGVTAVQLRDKEASGRELVALARALRRALAGTGVPLVINDRLDIALAAGADGVHLGQRDLPVSKARALAGRGLVIGLSVGCRTDIDEVHALPRGTVDYLGIGPVFTTFTKSNARPALGLGALAGLCESTHVPCVAIGGIDGSNVESVRSTGVDGVAVVSAICAAADARSAAGALTGGKR